ncbi:hypothetical protein PISL3812_09821 [Talaromyces islandicus]|uniref:F-box domain-containing protein n=1 Tax=Talaromyces islandicus TaxID=28573 RepID=A0A0U1MAV0_TALIS|nr:hypothetical protein PISL3812_09821 [Talaromyces islandicus]
MAPKGRLSQSNDLDEIGREEGSGASLAQLPGKSPPAACRLPRLGRPQGSLCRHDTNQICAYRMIPGGDLHGASPVASAFASLQTKQARQTALDRLLDLLQPEEWRRVYRRASKTLQRDIISCLPLELVVEITTYLHPREVLLLQRVSKQWQARLSSSAVYRPVLRSYCAPETETNLSPGGFRIFVKQRHNLETGSPCHEAVYPWLDGPDYSLDTAALDLLSFCSGKVAWVSRDKRRAFVRDLQAGTVADFMPVSRGTISKIHVSESFMFVQASGHCTVWNLATGQSTSVRIPSSSIFEINIGGSNLAMIIRSPANQHTLYSWNLIHGSLRSVDLDAIPMFTHWDEDASVITVIELDLSEESLCRFFRKRYSTTDDGPSAATPQDQTPPGQSAIHDIPPRGQHNLVLIESKLLVTKPRLGLSHGSFAIGYRYNQYLCRYGTAVTLYLGDPFLDVPIFICYRVSTDQLTVLTIDNLGGSPDDRIPSVKMSRNKLLSPEGLVYSLTWTRELKVHNVFTPSIMRRANLPVYYQDYFDGTGWLPFGNHQMYGVIGSKGIAIWSFDPDLNLK